MNFKTSAGAAALLLLVVPAWAHAADDATPGVLDLTGGVVGGMLDKVLSAAWSMLLFSVFTALIVEFVGPAAVQRSRDYGGIAVRLLLVVFALSFYPRLFGSVVNMADAVEAQLAPQDTWDGWMKKRIEIQETREREFKAAEAQRRAQARAGGDASPASPDEDEPGFWDGIKKSASGALGEIKEGFFDGLMGVAVFLGNGAFWILAVVARTLLVVFYVLGPLALVWAIPAGSGTGGRWFRNYLSIATWPIIAAVLATISSTVLVVVTPSRYGMDGAAYGVVMACVTVVLAWQVPAIASSIVGGSLGNPVSQGLSQMSGDIARGASSAREGAAGARSMAGRAGRLGRSLGQRFGLGGDGGGAQDGDSGASRGSAAGTGRAGAQATPAAPQATISSAGAAPAAAATATRAAAGRRASATPASSASAKQAARAGGPMPQATTSTAGAVPAASAAAPPRTPAPVPGAASAPGAANAPPSIPPMSAGANAVPVRPSPPAVTEPAVSTEAPTRRAVVP